MFSPQTSCSKTDDGALAELAAHFSSSSIACSELDSHWIVVSPDRSVKRTTGLSFIASTCSPDSMLESIRNGFGIVGERPLGRPVDIGTRFRQ